MGPHSRTRPSNSTKHEESSPPFGFGHSQNLGPQRPVLAPAPVTQKTGIALTKAPSTYQNCNCQCNSDTWTDGQAIRGNCNSADKSGALFCYISGSALCACRDIQQSTFLKDNNGRYKYYSYEACTTPERNSPRCNNGFGNQFGNGFGNG